MVSGDNHNVVGALLVRDGRVLLCHRHPDRRWYPNVWDLPGGHIATGETPADAIRRELFEELGVSVDLPSTEPWRVAAPAPGLTLHVWIVDTWHGTIENRAPDEHDEFRWFLPGETAGLELSDGSLEALIRDATTRCG